MWTNIERTLCSPQTLYRRLFRSAVESKFAQQKCCQSILFDFLLKMLEYITECKLKVSIMFRGTFLVLFVAFSCGFKWLCSTSPPVGNQVDGLPTALLTGSGWFGWELAQRRSINWDNFIKHLRFLWLSISDFSRLHRLTLRRALTWASQIWKWQIEGALGPSRLILHIRSFLDWTA